MKLFYTQNLCKLRTGPRDNKSLLLRGEEEMRTCVEIPIMPKKDVSYL